MVYNEAAFEVDALDLLGELEWQAVNGKELAPGSGERENWRDIVLLSLIHISEPTRRS